MLPRPRAKRLIKSTKRTPPTRPSLQPTKVPLPMDHVNVNRVALSALGAILFVMLLTASSNLLFVAANPEGSRLRAPDRSRERSRRRARGARSPPLPVLLAKADAKKGEAGRQGLPDLPQFREGRRPQDRPALCGVVGRPSLRCRLRLFRFARRDRRRLDLRSSTPGSATEGGWPRAPR